MKFVRLLRRLNEIKNVKNLVVLVYILSGCGNKLVLLLLFSLEQSLREKENLWKGGCGCEGQWSGAARSGTALPARSPFLLCGLIPDTSPSQQLFVQCMNTTGAHSR